MTDQEPDGNNDNGQYVGLGIAPGAAFGVIPGVAMDQLAVGIAIGAGVGTAIGAGWSARKQDDQDESKDDD